MVSLASRAVIAKYRLTRRKRVFADVDQLHRSLHGRDPAEAAPPRRMFERYRIDREELRGFPCYTLSPHTPSSARHILYLHGGAYVHQLEQAHWRFIARLVDTADCTVTVPVYPLAPEHRYDETLPMVWAAYEKVADESEQPRYQVLMGDSAGAGMSLHLAQSLRDAGRPQPGRVVLISPWLDITVSDPGTVDLDPHDPYLSRPGLREAGRLYAGELDPHDPRVSPIYGRLDGLTELSVFTGTRDLLLSDARRIRSLASEHGREIDYVEYPGMFHGWILQEIPEARQATEQVVHRMDDPEG